MKQVYSIFWMCVLIVGTIVAQPSNDNCGGFVDILSIDNYCSGTSEFTNVDATLSPEGGGPATTCNPAWNGEQRDVWFRFQATADIFDVSITINGNTLLNPQIAVYRGDCVDGLAELACVVAPNNTATAELILQGLDVGEYYYIRVNDYSATATPNSGTFQLCIKEYIPSVNMTNGTTTACTGTMYDSGGPTATYSDGESYIYTICPTQPHQCIFLSVSGWDIAGGDYLKVYDGPNIGSPQIGQFTGTGANGEAQASSGCMTLLFTSGYYGVAPGFSAEWVCSSDTCTILPPPPPNPTACSGVLYDTGGPFGSYNPNEVNTFTICPTEPHECIQLTVENYDIEYGDLLYIYDGPSTSSPIVGGVMGFGSNYTAATTSGCATIYFKSDYYGEGDGYKISWVCSQDTTCTNGLPDPPDFSSCNGTFFDNGGPFLPYLPNEDVIYTICPTDPHTCIDITVVDYSLSYGDVLRIYDGASVAGGVQIGKLEGGGAGAVFHAESACATVVFEANDYGQDTGYEITWSCSNGACDNGVPPPPDFSACSGTLFDVGGQFEDYNNMENTQYVVCPTEPHTCIKITIEMYNILYGDVLRVYDGSPNDGQYLAYLTETFGSNIVRYAESDCFTVIFQSDYYSTAPGFQISWECVNNPDCDNGIPTELDFTACEGMLYDDGGPFGPYASNQSTVHTICPAEPHDCVVLTVNKWDLNQGYYSDDKIRFYAGNSTSAPVIGAVLSGSGANYVVSSPECITIEFLSGDSPGQDGFEISWKCSDGECPLPIGPIDADGTVTAGDIIDNLIAPSVTVTNVVVNCPTGAYGTFNTPSGVSTNLGLESGIVLATGFVEEGNVTYYSYYGVEGPNLGFYNNASFSFFAPGDATLEVLTNGIETNDACQLEFDVYVPTNLLSFSYVFGSEEYSEYVGDFNDAFAFFLSGPGIVGEQNIALIPGTNVPVTIDNVNNGSSDDPYVIPSNPQYFVDNVGGFSVNYDGFTKVLKAKAKVQACNTYHIRLSIADALDAAYDSGVFIAANSLSSSITESAVKFELSPIYDAVMEGCADAEVRIELIEGLDNTDPITVTLVSQGSATEGADYLPVPHTLVFQPGDTLKTFPFSSIQDDISEGDEEAVLYMYVDFGCGNVKIDSVLVPIIEKIDLNILGNTQYCVGDTAKLRLNTFASFDNNVTWTPTSVVVGSNVGRDVKVVATTDTWMYATLQLGECVYKDSVLLDMIDTRVNAGANDTLCAGNSIPLLATSPDADIFEWTPTTGLDNPNVANPNAAPTETTTYIVEARNSDGCVDTDTVTLYVVEGYGVAISSDEPDNTVPQGDAIQLNAITTPNPNDAISYAWSPSAGLSATNIPNPLATPLESVTYCVEVTSVYGCVATDCYEITVTPPYYAIPNSFTPNDDGKNDRFEVIREGNIAINMFDVYNRWGQKVFDGTTTADQGWDGSFKNEPLPQDVYVYLIELQLPDGTKVVRKGDVNLLR